MEVNMVTERIRTLSRLIKAVKVVKEDNIPCKIVEGLYVGSLGAAHNKSALESSNITHILTVASSLHPAYPNNFVYKTIEVLDQVDVSISQYFDECLEFIEGARTTGGGVLVHCFAGRSRSITIVIAYLMYKFGMELYEAFEHVKISRPVASPNFGFMSQLKEFERSLQGTKTNDE